MSDAWCVYCDGTGDVHGIDGEWRGACTACDATAWLAYSKAWPEAMRGPRSRGQRLLDAGFKPRPRLTTAGGLMRDD